MDLSEVKTFEEQQVGKLTLSQAMRIGARLRPQCVGDCFSNDGRSCAIGAAYEATFGYQSAKPGGEIMWDTRTAYESSINQIGGLSVIYELNDCCGWSREKIADWLAEQGL